MAQALAPVPEGHSFMVSAADERAAQAAASREANLEYRRYVRRTLYVEALGDDTYEVVLQLGDRMERPRVASAPRPRPALSAASAQLAERLLGMGIPVGVR